MLHTVVMLIKEREILILSSIYKISISLISLLDRINILPHTVAKSKVWLVGVVWVEPMTIYPIAHIKATPVLGLYDVCQLMCAEENTPQWSTDIHKWIIFVDYTKVDGHDTTTAHEYK